MKLIPIYAWTRGFRNFYQRYKRFGVFLGLVLGKPIGITLAGFIAIKCKNGSMPANASWKL